MELSRYRAVCCQIIWTYSELLKDVARVDDISEIFDKLYLVFENFKIERHYVDQKWSSEVVASMSLTLLLDLGPFLALSIKELFVGQGVNLRAVKHLPMDQAEAFKSNCHHVVVQLAYCDQEASC